METLQYKIIKTNAQYNKYCNALEILVDSRKKTKAVQDEIELLTLLIEKYDAEHNTFDDADPIELLKSLMKDHKMKAVDVAKLLHVVKDWFLIYSTTRKGYLKKLSVFFLRNLNLTRRLLTGPMNCMCL